GTALELAKLAAYCAFYVAAVGYGTRHHRRLRIVAAIAAVSAVVAAIGLIQVAAGTGKILFFYVPLRDFGASVVRGTFVNPNHFGALLLLGAPCALVIALQEPRLRIPAGIAVVLCNV